VTGGAHIDWTALAQRLGTIGDAADTHEEIGGTDLARAAIEHIIDPRRLASAVDHYVLGEPGYELARSVLWLLHPYSAMQRCRAIFHSDAELPVRRRAIELLRVVADQRVLPWIKEFLDHPDPEIQYFGAGIVDQLLFAGLVVPADCAELLALAEAHENGQVRALAEEIVERTREATEG
jgi:hypothetical protein